LTRLFYSLCFVLLILTASSAVWATTLTVSDNLIVSEIDNTIVDHGFIGKKSTFSLKSGTHALILHYKDVFEDLDFAEDRVVKSKDFVVKFTMMGERQVSLSTVAIKNLAQAESFSKSPELVLQDEKNKQLKVELENVNDYKIAQQVDIAVNTYASKQAISNSKEPELVKTSIERKPVISLNQNEQTSNTLIQVNSLTLLKYWWKNASDEEKKQFKQYIKVKK